MERGKGDEMADAGKRSSLQVWAAIALLAVSLAPGAAAAQAPGAEFSFFGVKFGMTKAEIGQKWLPLSGGVYAVSSPAIRQIKPSFDHEGRLYEFTFSVDLQFPDDPAVLVNIAFQEVLNEKWKKKDAGLIVNLSSGRDGIQVGIVDERIRNGYIQHLRGKLDAILQP
ncbi:MAG: hypothetical protein ACYC9Y_04600 [Candidatus Methylomirabilia bacterium]